jgi:CRISPR-associated endonuclease/helicase Cas3
MTARRYYAHSFNGVPAHELVDHLIATAREAERRAQRIGLTGWGTRLGLAHDLGKFSDGFQRRVAGASEIVDHTTFGGQVLANRYDNSGRLLAYSVLGHHVGLPNGEDETDACLTARLSRTGTPDASAWEKMHALARAMPPDAPTLTTKLHPIARTSRRGFQFANVVRMAFSTLVDADRIDTERWYMGMRGRVPDRGNYASVAVLARQLDMRMAGFAVDSHVNRVRANILAACRAAIDTQQGIYSLTVPDWRRKDPWLADDSKGHDRSAGCR